MKDIFKLSLSVATAFALVFDAWQLLETTDMALVVLSTIGLMSAYIGCMNEAEELYFMGYTFPALYFCLSLLFGSTEYETSGYATLISTYLPYIAALICSIVVPIFSALLDYLVNSTES